ncbi:MAG TPA: NAD(P)H-binding protein [Thermoanaerobaculia bacterium]|nr:NAD(P)H-binding protein [Thermoanaerobaculia bacterium]
MRTLLLGATGLVGRELLSLLLADPDVERVTVVARRPSGVAHPKLDERVFDLAELAQHADAFAVDVIFCALGTTIKQAGSQERFRFVDYDLPLEAARLGRAAGARHYLVVTAQGANAKSRIFYSRVKGELEDALRTIGYPSLTIARPSLLVGHRTEVRRGERIAAKLSFLFPPSLKPISARSVARALVASAHERATGVQILDSATMRRRFDDRKQ